MTIDKPNILTGEAKTFLEISKIIYDKNNESNPDNIYDFEGLDDFDKIDLYNSIIENQLFYSQIFTEEMVDKYFDNVNKHYDSNWRLYDINYINGGVQFYFYNSGYIELHFQKTNRSFHIDIGKTVNVNDILTVCLLHCAKLIWKDNK